MCEKKWCLLYHIAYVIVGLAMVYMGYENIAHDCCSAALGIFFIFTGLAFSGTFAYRCYLSECRGKYPEQLD